MNDETPVAGREVADLLPWYATGRLPDGDRQRVSAALMSDAGLQRELALVLQERDAAVDGNEALGAPSRQAVDRFFAALDAQEAVKAKRFDVAGWFNALLARWSPRTVAWGAMAAAALLVVQAGVIGTFMSGKIGAPGTFESASVNPVAISRNGAALIVAFTPDATADAIGKLLAGNATSIVAGPLPGGLYELRVGDRVLSQAEADDLVARFKAETKLIRFVARSAAPE